MGAGLLTTECDEYVQRDGRRRLTEGLVRWRWGGGSRWGVSLGGPLLEDVDGFDEAAHEGLVGRPEGL